jgi:AP endonuclease-1
MWPPPDLDPANHPARSGFPIFALSPATVSNGSLNPSVPSRPMLLGAHVSMGGGPATALLRASKAGANGLALFVKNQRSWKSNPYEDEAIQRFRDLMRPRDEGGGCERISLRSRRRVLLLERLAPSRGLRDFLADDELRYGVCA